MKATKKNKLDNLFQIEMDDDDGMTPFIDRSSSTVIKQKPVNLHQTAIDITSDDLYERLTPHNVADLVLISMVMLPEAMPNHFQSTYTPIAAAGTEAQKKHMARLLATQLTTAGRGKGILEVQKQVDFILQSDLLTTVKLVLATPSI